MNVFVFNWFMLSPLSLLFLSVVALSHDIKRIHLNGHSFDPLTGVVPFKTLGGVRNCSASRRVENVYIVQYVSTPTALEQSALIDMNAVIHAAFEDDVLLVQMHCQTRNRLIERPLVRWIGPFLWEYRLDPALHKQIIDIELSKKRISASRYIILLVGSGQELTGKVVTAVQKFGGEVHAVGGGRTIEASFNIETLRYLTDMNEVLFIERWLAPDDDMD